MIPQFIMLWLMGAATAAIVTAVASITKDEFFTFVSILCALAANVGMIVLLNAGGFFG